MAPSQAQNLLSPAELAYLHASLSLDPPIRPDSRISTQFRPLIAETDILPGTNGSARICFPDGTEAVVGVKAEVEKSILRGAAVVSQHSLSFQNEADDEAMDDVEIAGEAGFPGRVGAGENSWFETTIEIPGFRDDDSLPVFLAAMLREALVATGDLVDKLWINDRWHWKLYIDILLLSPPLSYPVPLLSLTTHLALLSTRLPALKSELDEDPYFDDDWEAAVPLYPRSISGKFGSRPPVTLLVMAVGSNIIFDPTREELAVADAVLAVSLTSSLSPTTGKAIADGNGVSNLCLLSIRTIDPPSRLTTAGIPDSQNPVTGGVESTKNSGPQAQVEMGAERVWRPPQGGMKRALIGKVVEMCLKKGGVGEEVLAGLKGVEVGAS